MDPLVWMVTLALAPLVVLTVLHVNAATAFLGLCLGSLLGSFVTDDVVELLRGYVAPGSQVAESVVSLVLLWLPVVLVTFFMARTISNKQRFLNTVPALCVGLVGVLLTVPFLTPAVQAEVLGSDWWVQLTSYQAVIVLTGTVSSLLLLRMRKPLEGHHGKKHH